ncbi:MULTISPECIES: acyltransferase family protein [Derxia]|uniref:Acyltransferase family protein n=1 Tax=Derxia gummosa DSM 723 TaxID=1121388 RepID=A0A8B6XD28_9BURK|nr:MULTISPECIES: acyltransferase [Derxia]
MSTPQRATAAVAAPALAGFSVGYAAWLDLIRGAMALVVLAHHVAILALGVPEHADAISYAEWYQQAMVLFANAGHGAVMVFFVLSGFLVGGPMLARERAGSFCWRRYLAARMARILPVSLLATLTALMAAWAIGALQAGDPVLFRADFYWGMATADAFEPLRVLAHLFLLQPFTELMPTNAPLWSLPNEWWYYLVFPCLVIGVGRRRVGWLLLALLAGWLMLRTRQHWMFVGRFGVWMLGAFAHAAVLRLAALPAVRSRGYWSTLIGGTAVLLAAGLAWLPARWEDGYLRTDLLTGLGTTLVLLLLARFGRPLWTPVAHAAERLASVSFSVYAFHVPLLLVLLTAVGYGDRYVEFDAAGVAFGFSLMGVLIAACLGFWAIGERHTPRLRVWLEGRLERLSTRMRASLARG